MALNFFKSIFSSLFTISLLSSFFLPLNQENTDISSGTKEKNKLKSAIATIELIAIITIFIGSIIMISLGIIGYYIARIYEEIKGRPKYIISRTTRSSNNKQAESKVFTLSNNE